LLTAQQIIHLAAYKKSLDLCFAPPAPHQICIGHVSIEPNSRRKGIANALISHVLHDAKENTKRELILDVETANTGAFQCYLTAGFVEIRQTRFEATQQTFSRMRLLI